MNPKKINYPLILLVILLFYLCYIIYSLASNQAILADDLVQLQTNNNLENKNYFQFLQNFLDSAQMSPRPVSGIVYLTISYVSQFHYSYYFLGLLFFPINTLVLYFVTKKLWGDYTAIILTLIYSLLFFGTTMQFSPIMLNANLATIFWLLSVNFLIGTTQAKTHLFLSIFCFLLSVLSYEIFAPAIFLLILLIKNNKTRFFYFSLSISLLLLYRKISAPWFFSQEYHRENLASILDFKRDGLVLVLMVKMFFRDIFVVVYKSFLNLYQINLLEVVFLISTTILVYLTTLQLSKKFDGILIKKILKIALFGLLLSLLIFFFSTYKPTLFGFDNRNLGAVRLFFSVLLVAVFFLLTQNLKPMLKSAIISGLVMILMICSISLKNAWIYASDFNNTMFSTLSQDVKKIKTDCVKIDFYDQPFVQKNPNFILREPIFFYDWESDFLCRKNGIDPKKINVVNMLRKNNCNLIYNYPNRTFTYDENSNKSNQ